MSLSPFDSFQSRFVTYLLNFPHIYQSTQRDISEEMKLYYNL